LRYILIILLFTATIGKAINAPPLVLRACLNYDTDIVTLSWKQSSDLCGSFTKYTIYGSEDNGPFLKIDDVTDFTVNQYPHQLITANTAWQYYVTILHLCNGIDSATSNTVLLDNTYPITIELDSLSYDLNTQDIIAGWSPNPSPDNKGYELYDYNYISESADSIGTTIEYSINITNLRTGHFPVVLSSYDSCNLTSVFSTPHRAVKLTGVVDTCDRSIYLHWNRYEGWNTIDSQFLYVSINGGSFFCDTALSNWPNSFYYRNLRLGDTIAFYIKTRQGGGSVTSSSSKVTFETRELTTPSHLYLSSVTVNDNAPLKSTTTLSWNSSDLRDLIEFQIQRKLGTNLYMPLQSLTPTLNQNNYVISDLSANADLNIYTYRTLAINKCYDTVLISNESSNILLNIIPSQNHNPYNGWENGVSYYEFQFSKDRSTWNTQYSDTDPILLEQTDTVGCYRVLAAERTNTLNYSSITYSNVQCRSDSLKFYVTTALVPGGVNNKFTISGRGIDYEKSTYEIYNRWGQLLTRSNISTPWYALYQNSPVPSGIYIYITHMYGVLGQYQKESGTINVIR
jgi:hypothetical protein